VVFSNPQFVRVQPALPFDVGAGSSANLLIRFAPTEVGPRNATMTLETDDPAKPSIQIALTGTGASLPDSSALLRVDDGTFELSTGFSQGGIQGYFVNRLTPASYPATLRKVLIAFPPSAAPPRGLPLNSTIQIISAATTGSGDQIAAPAFTRSNGSVTAFDTFIEYDVPPLTIQNGSFLVGFTVLNPANTFPAWFDSSSASARRSYVGDGGTSIFLVDNIPGVGPGNFAIRAKVESGGGNTGSSRVAATVAAGWPNGRTSGNLPAAAIDGNTATYTWTTESSANVNPSYLGIGFPAAASIHRIRLFKDADSGGAGLSAKHLVVEYTTSPVTVPLALRTWTPVTGLANGFGGAELLTATSVNANGTVVADLHNSLASGWASLTFNAVNATGIRIGFSNAATLQQNHYRVYEFEAYSNITGN